MSDVHLLLWLATTDPLKYNTEEQFWKVDANSSKHDSKSCHLGTLGNSTGVVMVQSGNSSLLSTTSYAFQTEMLTTMTRPLKDVFCVLFKGYMLLMNIDQLLGLIFEKIDSFRDKD